MLSMAIPVKNPDPKIEFLFRFRDLVAHTLNEHEAIIKEHGSCWWGWWKRPSEDNRLTVWSKLAEEAKNNPSTGGLPVGLFDSGTGKVHSAWVTEVILPESDSATTSGRIDVPAAEKKLVPAYYRDSPFSRAWIRIVKIEHDIAFFGEFSFAEAPKLPNYDPATLNRLKDKVIVDPDELRGMDTTIWAVRPKRPEDPSQTKLS